MGEQARRRSQDQPDTRSEGGSMKGETVGHRGQGEPRKIRPSFQPPASGGRPPSEVRSSPGSPPSSHTEPQTPRGEHADGELEGMLVRKHEWESTTKKASNSSLSSIGISRRSWEKLCVVLKGSQIIFYKDQKTYRTHPGDTFKGETPVDLINCTAEVATDYTKKKYVFRLRLANGGFYLFQAADEEQMDLWVNGINAQAQPHEEGSKSQTLPPGSEKKDEPKRRSFFTLKKN